MQKTEKKIEKTHKLELAMDDIKAFNSKIEDRFKYIDASLDIYDKMEATLKNVREDIKKFDEYKSIISKDADDFQNTYLKLEKTYKTLSEELGKIIKKFHNLKQCLKPIGIGWTNHYQY